MKLPSPPPRAGGHWKGQREYESKYDAEYMYKRLKSGWGNLGVRGSSVCRSKNDLGNEGI